LQRIDPSRIFVRRSADGTKSFTRLQEFGLTDIPSSYFVFRLVSDLSGTNVRLESTLTYFRTSISRFRPNAAKRVELAFSFLQPDETGDNRGNDLQSKPSVSVVFPSIRAGQVRRFASHEQSGWTTLQLPLSSEDVDAVKVEMQRTGKSDAVGAPSNLLVSYREIDRPLFLPELLSQVIDAFKGKP
jgi:hypothetical protein